MNTLSKNELNLMRLNDKSGTLDHNAMKDLINKLKNVSKSENMAFSDILTHSNNSYFNSSIDPSKTIIIKVSDMMFNR